MLDRFTGKKRGDSTSTQRHAILRGVYDQNRGLRAPARPARPARRSPGKGVLALLTLVTAVAGVQFLHASGEPAEALLALFSPAPRIAEGAPPMDGPTAAPTAAPAQPALAATEPTAGAAQTPPASPAAVATSAALPEAAPSAAARAVPASPPPATDIAVAAAPPSPPAEARPVSFEQPRPPLPVAATLPVAKPVELADVVPALSGKDNLKSLFGLSVKTIIVDAGHGGHDPGALGKTGTREKDITLDVAQRLKDKLESGGEYRVVLVRDDDVFVPLKERAAFANAHDTDLFVSIHVNYLPSTSTNAVETYYFGRHQDARTRKLAERENEGSEYSLSEFENVMRNVQDTIKLQESQALAHAIQGTLLASIRAQNKRVLDNGVRTAPFVVLLGVKAPSVLVEIGSLSSPEAERNLRKEGYRDEIASYVAAGIGQYLNTQFPQEREIHDQDKSKLAERP